MADSDDSNSYDGYSDDGYENFKMRRARAVCAACICRCKRCFNSQQPKNNMEYNERNKNAWRARDARDSAHPEASCKLAAEMESRLRHTVMEHGGFRVSFPGLNCGYEKPGDEEAEKEAEKERKTQKCIENGLWNDEVKQRYVQLIDDFNTRHDFEKLKRIGAAFPRFSALVGAACHSSQLLLCRPSGNYAWHARVTRSLAVANRYSLSNAVLPASSVFTETTQTQRNRLLAFSGITGMLISRLLLCGKIGTYDVPSHYAETLAKCAIITTRRAHSMNACEIVADNRYIFPFQGLNGPSIQPPPPPPPKRSYKDVLSGCKPAKPVPASFIELLAELRELYPATISKVMVVARQVQGGLSIDAINSNEQFTRLHDLKIILGKRLMDLRNEAENPDDLNDTQFKRSVRIMRFMAEFPQLFSHEFSRLFGMSSLRLRVATIEAQLRLARQGCYAAILSFAAVEPRMMDAFLCPVINTQYGGIDRTHWDNHIHSSDEVFGPLLLKHGHHIPRTADVIDDVCRKTMF